MLLSPENKLYITSRESVLIKVEMKGVLLYAGPCVPSGQSWNHIIDPDCWQSHDTTSEKITRGFFPHHSLNEPFGNSVVRQIREESTDQLAA